ncbi:uncharacterized protein LOC130641933 [Hydractinia symbiolongicarpus]|uniref:uncharacterized protein LOC130641933 n=1 Tax=Hydractinia symbiolongicarpus TaxID=13093 RepID=UPI00254CDBDA|nr:uncharacterized protein LOC130641933 [Hydractinia symbiolongicarpus]
MQRKMIRIQHFTRELFAKQINLSKCVEMSTGQTHARHGSGSYWTSLHPAEYDKQAIAENNYDSNGSMQSRLINMGKLDWVVEVKIPINDPYLQKINIEHRDIYIYKKKMNLGDFEHKIDKFENFKFIENVSDLGDYFCYLDEYFNEK